MASPSPEPPPPGLLQVPSLQLDWLRAGFSTRQGGDSTVYAGSAPGELNLGWTEHDPEPIVAANRARFTAHAAAGAPMQLVTIRQFHSGMIRIVEADHGTLATDRGRAVLRGDALMTDVPGLLLGIQTADCVPVLLADRRLRAVAAFHAGWRGTVARIVERGVGLMRLRYGSRPEDLVAAIGPAIASCCFAVGDEVRRAFDSQFAYAPELFRTAEAPTPQLYADLFEANRRQLLDAGLLPSNITVTGECSACTRTQDGRRKYFSHRAERGFTGRMMSVIGICHEGEGS